MADRSSAYLFGLIFDVIAKDVSAPKRKTLARKFWKESFDYDFTPDQMYCDKSLLALGLAKKGLHPDYPEDGPVTLYATLDGKGYEP